MGAKKACGVRKKDRGRMRPPRRHDKKKIQSLWRRYAPAAWWPIEVDEAQVRSLSAAYSLRELRQMAAQLGIDARLSKMALARCIVSEKNIFFPNEAGNYDHNTLVFFVRQFQVLPDLNDKEAQQMNNVELQNALLGAWKGGTDESMNINLQHVIELYEIVAAMEDKFCSSHVKKLFREPAEEGQPSFYEYVEKTMTDVLDLYQQWLNVKDTKAKRKIFVATQLAYSNAEAAVTEYLRMIRKHCRTESFNDCDADNIPPLVMHWMRTSTWDDRIILCNVTVKGKNVDFAEGDELVPGYTVGVAVRVTNEDRENVVWLGLGRPNHPVNEGPQPLGSEPSEPYFGGGGSFRPPRPPDYSRPFDAVQLGELMDRYERQPRRRGQPRQHSQSQGQGQGQPVGLPIDMGLGVGQPTAQPLGMEMGLGPPVGVGVGVGQPLGQPVTEPTTATEGFKEKAKELAKDMLSMGMDIAQQAVIALLLGALFPQPHFFIPGPAEIAPPSQVPVPEQKAEDEPPAVDVRASQPVPAATVLDLAQKPPTIPLPETTSTEVKVPTHRPLATDDTGSTLLAGVNTPWVPRAEVTYPVVSVPQSAEEPPSLREGPEPDPEATTVISSSAVAVIPEVSQRWQYEVQIYIYDLLRLTTPQGHPAFPIINVKTGNTDQDAMNDRLLLDWSGPESVQVPTFRQDTTGNFQLQPLLPSSAQLTDHGESQFVPPGTFCPVPAVKTLVDELQKLTKHPDWSRHGDLQTSAEQLQTLTQYRPATSNTVAFLNVAHFLNRARRHIPKEVSRDQASTSQKLLGNVVQHIMSTALVVRPVATPTSQAATSSDLSVVFVPSRRWKEIYQPVLDHTTPALLTQLDTLRRNTRSSAFDLAAQRLNHNLRLLFLQFWLVSGPAQAGPQPSVASNVAVPTLAVNPHSLSQQVAVLQQELTHRPHQFYHVTASARERFALVDLPQLGSAVEQTKVHWKDAQGGYSTRGDLGTVPYSSVRAVNVWDTEANIGDLFSRLDPNFVGALIHLPEVTKDAGSSAQAVRDLQMLGHLIRMFQTRTDSRSRALTVSQPRKFTLVDVSTAWRDLQRDPRFQNFLNRYQHMLAALTMWQNLHAQETHPWQGATELEPFQQQQQASDWRSSVVYVQLNVDVNQQWPNVLQHLHKNEDTVRQSAGLVLKLGSWLTAAQWALGTPTPEPQKPIHSPSYGAMVRAFEEYTQRLTPLLKLPGPPQTDRRENIVVWQPSLQQLNQRTDETLQAAQALAASVPQATTVQQAAQTYIQQAQVFRHLMNTMFAHQAQTRVATLDLNAARYSLALVPTMVTVHIPLSVLRNALFHILKDTGVTARDITGHVTPHNQLVVHQAVTWASTSTPTVLDLTEPAVPLIIPDLQQVARVLQSDPLAAGHRGLQQLMQNIWHRFPLAKSGGSGALAATTTTLVSEGQSALTKELGKFPAVSVPAATLPQKTLPATVGVPVNLPSQPERSPWDVALLMPPVWASKAPVHLQIYSDLPRIKDSDVGSVLDSALRALAAAPPVTGVDVKGIGQTLQLWRQNPTWPVPNLDQVPLVAPDFAWLNNQMRGLYDSLTRQPLADHALTQNLLGAARAISKLIEDAGLHEITTRAGALASPVVQSQTSTAVVQQLLGQLRDVGPLLATAREKAPEATVQTLGLVQTLQNTYAYARVRITDTLQWLVLPDVTQLYEGVVVPWGQRLSSGASMLEAHVQKQRQTLDRLKEAYEASQRAEQERERERDRQHYLTLQATLEQTVTETRDWTYNAVVASGSLAASAAGTLSQWGQAVVTWLEQQDQRRVQQGVEARQARAREDERNYQQWKKNVWQALVTAPQKAHDRALQTWEVVQWTAGWTLYLSVNLAGGMSAVVLGTVTAGVNVLPLLVDGMIWTKQLAVQGWELVVHRAPGAVQTALTVMGSKMDEVREGWNSLQVALNHLPSTTPMVEGAKASLSAVGGTIRTLINAGVTLVTTLDLSWTEHVMDVMHQGLSTVKGLGSALGVWARSTGVSWSTSAWTKVENALSSFSTVVEALVTDMQTQANKPAALAQLQDQFGRDLSSPLTTPAERAMGGYYRKQLQKGALRNLTNGEKLVNTDRVRKDLQRLGIEAGSVYSTVKEPLALGLPERGPTLTGIATQTLEGLVNSNRVHKNRMQSRTVSRASLRRLRTSERRRLDNMQALFHRQTNTPVVELTLRAGVPSADLANASHPSDLDVASQASVGMLDAFLTDTARELHKGHTANSVRDTIQDQLETVASAVLAEPMANRKAATVAALHGLGSAVTLDNVVCLSATLALMIDGFYSYIYNREFSAFCFSRTPPMTHVSSTYLRHTNAENPILFDPAQVGVLVDPEWRATDAEAVLRNLRRYQYPATPFCLVGDTTTGALQCVPVLETAMAMTGESLYLGYIKVKDPALFYSQAILAATSVSTSFVTHATTNELDRPTWESIASRATNMAATMGAPLDLTLQNMAWANASQPATCQMDENRLKALVVRSYAVGADPLSTEYFRLPFRLLSSAPTVLAWQKASGVTDLLANIVLLERNGVHGPALLMRFRDWLVQRLPAMVNVYDRYLHFALKKSMLDRNLMLLDSIRWLNAFGAQVLQSQHPLALPGVLPQVLSAPSPLAVPSAGADLMEHAPVTTSPADFLAAYRQEMQTQFGSPFSVALVQQANEVAFATQQFLDQTNTSGLFDLCALSLMARTRARGGLDVDVTPTLWGSLLAQANTLQLLCERMPRVQGQGSAFSEGRGVDWQGLTKIVQNAAGLVSAPFRFNSHGAEERWGQCQADPLVRATNYAHAALTVPWRNLTDQAKEEINVGLQRLHELKGTLSQPAVASSVARMAETVSEDVALLLRMNGAEATAQLWTPRQKWSRILAYPQCIAAENTVVLEHTDSSVLGDSAVSQAELPVNSELSVASEQLRIPELKTKVTTLDPELQASTERMAARTWFSALGEYANGFLLSAQMTLVLANPIPGLVGVAVHQIAMPHVKGYIAETTWWKDTNAMLERHIHPGVLTVTKVAGEVVITLVIGKFVVSFFQSQVPNYQQLMDRSPLQVFVRSGNLYQQLEASGVDTVTRQVVEALQQPDLFVAAQKTLGTSPEAIERLFGAFEQGSVTALKDFIESFSSLAGGSITRLGLLESLDWHTLLVGQETVAAQGLNTMMQYAQQQFAATAAVATTLAQQQQPVLSESMVAVTRSIVALAGRVAEGNRALQAGGEALRQQLAQMPLP